MTSKDVAEHELKIASQFFDVVESGQKPFEIRKGDRPFKIGDTLWLREVNIVLAYTGREIRKRITFCLRGWGMEDGYVALGLAPLQDETLAPLDVSAFDPGSIRQIAENLQEADEAELLEGYACEAAVTALRDIAAEIERRAVKSNGDQP